MKKLLSPLWLLGIAALGTAVLSWAYWGGWNIHPHANAEKLGQLGDFFGGMLNPLVSALTLFVAISVWRLQKDELEQARIAMEQTNLAMKEQAVTAEQQRQEQRFFDLLNIYHRSVDSTTHLTTWEREGEFHSGSNSYKRQISEQVHFRGKEALDSLCRQLKKETLFGQFFEKVQRGDYLDTVQATISFRETLQKHWRNSKNVMPLESYFRVVFRILAESEDLLGNQHDRYAKLLRDQLSRAELDLLGLSLWLDEDDSSRLLLAEKYGLLKHLPQSHLRAVLQKDLPASVFDQESDTTSATTSKEA
jgi:hypothetical protein